MFECKDFLECDASVVRHILKLNSLSCSEDEIFKACLNWARTTDNVEPSPFSQPLTQAVVQIDHEKLFNDPRFKWMTPQELALLIPSYTDLFSCDEFSTIWHLVGEGEGNCSNLFHGLKSQ